MICCKTCDNLPVPRETLKHVTVDRLELFMTFWKEPKHRIKGS